MRGGGWTLYPWVEYPLLPQVNSDSVHRDEIGEVVSSLLKGFQKLQITRLFSFPFIITYRRVAGGGGGTLYPGVECPPLPQVNSVCVHRDEIGENVSSILSKGFQKLQITRLFSFPLS